jgi:hypothetical protein
VIGVFDDIPGHADSAEKRLLVVGWPEPGAGGLAIEEAVSGAGIEERRDVRVLQGSGGLDLTPGGP